MAKSVRLMIKNVRCNFPKLYVAEEFKGKKNYSIGLMIPTGSPIIEQIEKAAKESIGAQYPGKIEAMFKRFKGSRNTWPIRELDDDTFIVSPKRKEENGAPIVMDQKKNLLPADSGLPYAGCWVNASVDVFCYNKEGGGVTMYLNGVQLVKEDAPLSGVVPATACKDDFDAIDDMPEDNSDLL